MLGSVFVDYYGSATPLSQVAKRVLMQEPSHFSHLKEICFTPSKKQSWWLTLVLIQ
jgi:hypothetical protein